MINFNCYIINNLPSCKYVYYQAGHKQETNDFFYCLFHFLGKILEQGLKREGMLAFVRELDGNENESINNYLRDASMYARGKRFLLYLSQFEL